MSKRKTTEEFIEKANIIHNNKYDYSKVEYKSNSTKVCIICPEHGEFWQTPYNHLRGCGCPKCVGKNKKTTEEFIRRAKEVHGDKYDYSKVEYINAKTKVCIICPEHGEFWQIANRHLSGCGCPKCVGKNKTTEEFIRRAKEVHGDKYDYSKVKYVNNSTKVCIICPEHGEFWQKPAGHLRGCGCPKCKGKNKTAEEVIEKARKVHGDKYDYSKVVYKGMHTKVCIICPEHGEFWQTLSNHLKGCGCYKCGRTKKGNYILVQKYIDKCTEKYKGFYDYSQIDINNVNYVSHTKVPIICPEHGMFKQNLYQHLNCVCPCQMCRRGINTKSDNKNKIQTVIQDRIEHGIIYCYTNKNNRKKYIGQTIDKEGRKYGHLNVNQKYKTLFDKILQKEGEENFEYEILFEIDEKRSKIFDILNEKEKYYIKLYNSQVPNGYNISEGGKSVKWMVGYKPTQETLQKLRDSHKGKQNPMKGKHYSEEQRKRMVEKWRNTMQEKFNNGYITQRKNIIVFENKQNKGTYPNAKEIERVFGVNYKRVHYALKRMQPLDNKWIFIYEEKYSDHLLDSICTKTYIQQKPEKLVQQMDRQGNIVAILKLSEAIKQFGTHIFDVCNGKRKTAGGYIWNWSSNNV